MAQDRPGAGGVVHHQIGTPQLHQGLDGDGWDGVGEQRPKASVEVADKSRKHTNPHRHQRRWEGGLQDLGAASLTHFG